MTAKRSLIKEPGDVHQKHSWSSFKSNILICLSAPWREIFAARYYFVIAAVKLSLASSYPPEIGAELNFPSPPCCLIKSKLYEYFLQAKPTFTAISHLSGPRFARRRWLMPWKLIRGAGGEAGWGERDCSSWIFELLILYSEAALTKTCFCSRTVQFSWSGRLFQSIVGEARWKKAGPGAGGGGAEGLFGGCCISMCSVMW